EIEIESKRYREELMEIKMNQHDHNPMICNSAAMKKVIEIAKRISKVDSNVLILGESGVGKGVLTTFIHENSKRSISGSIVKINCGALPENILESELFGYEKGTFTGALKD